MTRPKDFPVPIVLPTPEPIPDYPFVEFEVVETVQIEPTEGIYVTIPAGRVVDSWNHKIGVLRRLGVKLRELPAADQRSAQAAPPFVGPPRE